jgi:hypothetical protein
VIHWCGSAGGKFLSDYRIYWRGGILKQIFVGVGNRSKVVLID